MHRRHRISIMLCMDAEISELQRLIENLIRIGTVAEVDGDHIRVKRGKTTSNWIRWATQRAGQTSKWSAPSVGEQVVMLAPGGDTASAIAILGLYSDEFPAPSLAPNLHTTHYDDGAVIEYDHDSHALRATLPEGGTAAITAPAHVIVISQTITLDAEQTTCTGKFTAQGLITGQAGISISGAGTGGAAAQIQGTLQATGDIKAGNISLQGHHHTEQGNGAPTSAAQS